MATRTRTTAVLIAVVLSCAVRAAAGQSDRIAFPEAPALPDVIARDADGHATVRAVRLTEPLKIDGVLDESVYSRIHALSDFVQSDPEPRAPASEKTEVWVFFDRDAVYVSARCWESHPERMVVNEMRRDSTNILQNESFSFLFDTFYDRRNSAIFHVNALGGRRDGQATNEMQQFNADWNPVWSLRVGRFDGGWTVEAAVPFKSLRYRAATTQIWGFQARRMSRWRNELSAITPLPSGRGSGVMAMASLAATLVGLEAPPARRTLELKPFALANLDTSTNATGATRNSLGATYGGDLTYAVSRNNSLNLTYRTDFAQVEADEQQINLTRFSLFFPEKREFFLDNQGVFSFGGVSQATGSDVPLLFYSRRIGLANGTVVPIDGGGRLTGRAGRFEYGILSIDSSREHSAGALPTNFTVARVKRDILRRSSVGALFGARSVGEDGAGRSTAYGVDGTFAFFDNLTFATYWAETGSDRPSRTNTSYRGALDYSADRYGLQLERLTVGADFAPEIGYVRRPDIVRHFGQFRFSPRPRSHPSIRRLSSTVSADAVANGAGVLQTRGLTGELAVEFQNSDRASVSVSNDFERLPQPFPIASGVVIPTGDYDYSTLTVGMLSGQQRRLSGNVSAELGRFYDGTRRTLTLRQSRLGLTSQLSIEPSFSANWVDLPQGSFTSHLVGGRITYTLTPLTFVSGLVQYNSATHLVGANVRLRWEYHPGSELFVVLNEERDTAHPSFPDLRNRALIVKINRLFRY